MRKIAVLFALPACAAALLACGNKTETGAVDAASHVAEASAPLTTAPQALTDASAADASVTPPRRGLGMHGQAGMLLDAARTLTLKDDQKTAMDKLEEPLREPPAARTEWKNFQKELSDGVKAGKIDMTKLAPDLTAIETGAHTQKEKEATALNALHSTLDAEQRKAAVVAVRAKLEPMEKRADAGAEDVAKRTAAMNKQRLDQMTRDLDLDAAQQKKVEAIIAKDSTAKNNPAEMMAEMKKANDEVLTAFEKDSFDATKLETFAQAGKKARTPAEHQAQFLSQVLGVLTPVQRDKMAGNMNRMGPMMDRPGMPMRPGLMPHGMPNGTGEAPHPSPTP